MVQLRLMRSVRVTSKYASLRPSNVEVGVSGMGEIQLQYGKDFRVRGKLNFEFEKLDKSLILVLRRFPMLTAPEAPTVVEP